MCQGFLIRSVVSCVDVSGLQHPTTFTKKPLMDPYMYISPTLMHMNGLLEKCITEFPVDTTEFSNLAPDHVP